MKAFMDKHWKSIFLIYIIVMVAVSLFFAFVFRGENNFERGVYWTNPIDGGTYNTELNMTGRIYCRQEIKSAELIFNGEKTYPIEQTIIKHKGKDLFTICVFMNEVSMDEGINDISVKILTEDKEHLFHTATITAVKEYKGNDFVFFSQDHILAVLSSIAAFFILIWIYKLRPTENMRMILYVIVMLLVLGCDLVNRATLYFDGSFNIQKNMPFHMCDISATALFAFMFMKKGKARDILFDMLFIWGVAGVVFALATPDMIGYGFPSFFFFNFFLRHGGIVVGVLLVMFIEGYRPRLKAIPRVLLFSAIMGVVAYGINWLVALYPPYDVGNYMFIMYPPLGGSPIDMLMDIFGPSPFYTIGLILLAAIVYVVFWIPFGIETAIKNRKKM